MKNCSAIILLCVALTLAGCSQVRDELGLTRNSPDEFTVVKRAPLTLPPEYTLAPPGESSRLAVDNSTSNEARAVVFGSNDKARATADTGDAVFLQKIGADQADATIRTTIERENGMVTVENQSTIEKIFNRSGTQDAVIVDAQKEAERIRTNTQTGQAINTGEVPVIEKKQSTIDKLF